MKSLRDKLEEALNHGGNLYTLDDVLREVQKGTARVWATEDSAVVTMVEDFPQGKSLFFWLAAGDLEQVLELAQDAYAWGREQGCTRAVCLGRKGWTKPLAGHGWEPKLVQFTKEL